MRAGEFFTKWSAERTRLGQYGQRVDPVLLLDDILRDVTELLDTGMDELLTLRQAARESGYSRGHLGRLVKKGKIPTAGRPNAPKIRLSDLPRKAGYLPPEQVPTEILFTSRRQIVRSIVNPQHGRTR